MTIEPAVVSELSGVTRLGEERTVEQFLAANLRRWILDGTLKPGVRLPYRELASQFGVSVTPVRIALKELSSEGLVDMRPHSGARVSELSGEELEEIMLTRAGIEPWLALKSAGQLADEDIAMMSRHLEEVRTVTHSLDRAGYLRAQWEFKVVCYGAAQRPRLLTRLSTLYDLSRRYHYLNLSDRDRLNRSFSYLETFHEACVARDGVTAQAVMREAIEWTLDYLVKSVEPS